MSVWSEAAKVPRAPRPQCYCRGFNHPHGVLSTCPPEPVPYCRPLMHITVTKGTPLDGLMCGAEPDAARAYMPLKRARARAADPGNLWDLCPACADASCIDENGDDLDDPE